VSGLILLAALRAVELILLGRRSIPIERVFVEEERSHRFEGFLEDGTVLRFQVHDPVAFRRTGRHPHRGTGRGCLTSRRATLGR
jgi:hypothetical protein